MTSLALRDGHIESYWASGSPGCCLGYAPTLVFIGSRKSSTLSTRTYGHHRRA